MRDIPGSDGTVSWPAGRPTNQYQLSTPKGGEQAPCRPVTTFPDARFIRIVREIDQCTEVTASSTPRCWSASSWLAAPIAAEAAGPQTLSGVIDSLRLWVVGLLAGLATLFLTIGGIRYMTAGGDPGQIERAKSALRSAAIGYALAALSPVLVAILQSIVGS